MFLDNLFTAAREQLFFVVHVFKESTVQVMLWDLIVAVRNPWSVDMYRDADV